MNDNLTEYAHGSFEPIRTLADHQGTPTGCAVDLATGDLAIANFSGPSSNDGNVTYRGAKGSPTKFTIPNLRHCSTVAYDNTSNLFVDGVNLSISSLAELPKGKTAFKALQMNQTISEPGGIAWDGQFLAYADQDAAVIYQFKISGSKANVQGSTTLSTGGSNIFQIKVPHLATAPTFPPLACQKKARGSSSRA